jgi:hypothetical protein
MLITMAASPTITSSPVLRVAAVWGTTVVALRTLKRGQSFTLGDKPEDVLPAPDGVDISPMPVRAAQGGWELDARGAIAGVLHLRGRDEDPAAIAKTGAPIPIFPGDYGLVQYGQFGIFFQYTSAAAPIAASWAPETLVALALVSSGVLHAGLLGLLRGLMTPPPIAKPLELTNPDEYAARFGLKRIQTEEPALVQAGDKSGGSGVKDPGAQDKKPQGGGRKMKGDEGKLGQSSDKDHTELTGEIKPAEKLGGISDVLNSETGEEIKKTLSTISTVSEALSGLNSQNIVLGSGPGTSLKGAGSGGGGVGLGVAFGSGTLDTGWGPGTGGGYGSGTGGPGGRGSGGSGLGGRGGGTGIGSGNGSGENRVGIVGNAPPPSGGLTAEQIRRVVVAHSGALRACYESEVQRNPSLKGGVTMQWNIEPGGTVTSASVAGSTINNARVEGCIVRQVKTWKFPAASQPTTVGAYPFKFGIGGG